jgi:hypothetical protein
MADPRYHSARRITNVVQFMFNRGDHPFTVTIPLEDVERLMADTVNTLRDAAQLPAVEPSDIGLAVRGELDTETRTVRKIRHVETVRPEDATQPTILRITTETATGPMALRISRHAAEELTVALNTHALTRGSA